MLSDTQGVALQFIARPRGLQSVKLLILVTFYEMKYHSFKKGE